LSQPHFEGYYAQTFACKCQMTLANSFWYVRPN